MQEMPALDNLDYKLLLNSELLIQQRKFWENKLSEDFQMKKIFNSPKISEKSIQIDCFDLKNINSDAIINFCNNNHLSLYIYTTTVIKVILRYYLSENVISILSPLYSKGNNSANCINDIVILNDNLNSDITFKETLLKVNQTIKQAYKNQYFPIKEIVNKTDDVKKSFESISVICRFKKIHLDLNEEYLKDKIYFDFSFENNEIKGKVHFNSSLYNPEILKNFIVHLTNGLNYFYNDLNTKISALQILDHKELNLLNSNSNIVSCENNSGTLIKLFDEQVNKNKDVIALLIEDKQITYGELNEKVNNLALKLIEEGACSDKIVALYFESSLEMIVGILSVLKSGAAFLPIDINIPKARLSILLNDVRPDILLSNLKIESNANFNGKEINISYDQISTTEKNYNFQDIKPESLAYIIFTSGSTGKPKGVLIDHKSIYNSIKWRSDSNGLDSKDVALQLFNYAFDGFLTSFFTPLVSGSKIVLLSENTAKQPQLISDVIIDQQITNFICVPSLFKLILEKLKGRIKAQNSLIKVTLAGEKLNKQLVEESISFKSNLLLINEYGPTENSVVSTYCNKTIKIKNGCIGVPIEGSSALILNKDLNVLPSGIPGDLYLMGKGLSRGYLNNPELTAERFVKDKTSFNEIYKSGDIAYKDNEGNIYFIDRSDKQVKINGNRIELGEIESLLLQYPEIEECIAINTKNNNNDIICVFFTSKGNISNTKLTTYLSDFLPYYMIPQYFIQLESVPLNSFKKTDYSKLKSKFQSFIEKGNKKVEPTNDIEKIIVGIWMKILSNNDLGVTDNFFSIGGDSTRAIQVSSELNSLGYKVSIKDIFKYPTVIELSENIDKTSVQIEQNTIIGDISLTPSQRKYFTNLAAYDNVYSSYLLSFQKEIDEDKIVKIFRFLQFHHDGLRIVFEKKGNDVPRQINKGADSPLSIKTFNCSNEQETLNEIKTVSQRLSLESDPFKGSLMHIALFKLPNKIKLLVSVHKLIIDFKSWNILFDDFNTLLNQSVNNQNLELPEKTDSFLNWSNVLTEYKKSSGYLKAKSYWEDYDKKDYLPLLRDNNKTSLSKNIKKQSIKLDSDKANSLLNRANDTYGTNTKELILCSLLLSFNKIFGSTNARIDVYCDDRSLFGQELNLNRTIGNFLYFFPFILDWKNCSDIRGLIINVKEHIRRIASKGIDYSICKYLDNALGQNEDSEAILSPIKFSYVQKQDSRSKDKNLHIVSVDKELFFDNIQRNEYDFEISISAGNNELEVECLYCEKHSDIESVNRISEELNDSINTILNHCLESTGVAITPIDLTYKDLDIELVDQLQEEYEIEDIYTLSPLQEGMLYHALLDKRSAAYFQQQVYTINGTINHEKIKDTLNEITSAYDVFRTQFLYEGLNRPIQLVKKNQEIEYTFIDSREEIKTSSKNEIINGFLSKDRKQTFNLSTDNLMRVAVLQTDNEEFEFIWSFHHILMDSWCLNLINKEFLITYCSKLKNDPYTIPKPVQYKEYIKWIEKQDITLAKNYWKNYLKNFTTPTGLTKRNKAGVSTNLENESFEFQLSDEVYDKVKKLCVDSKISTSMLFHALWGVLLAKYNDQSDVLFGTVVSGRPSELQGLDTIVGLFINTIPIRLNCKPEQSFSSLLEQTTENVLEGERHSYLSMADIRTNSKIQNAIFDHIFIFESANATRDGSLNWTNDYIQFSNPRDFQKTNYDLNIIVSEHKSVKFKIKYNPQHYEDIIIKRIQDDVYTLVDQITANPKIDIEKINLVSTSEKETLLHKFNDLNYTKTNYKPIIRIIEDMVELYPDKVAVVHGDKSLSYKELDDNANKLAGKLNILGCQKNDFIPILYDKGLELLITILGILKSGAAYVPVDCSWPTERIKEILKDIKPKFGLTNKKSFIDEFDEFEIYNYSEESNNEETEYSTVQIDENDPIYAIYTSGSTGTPKGTINLNKGITNRFLYQNKRYKPKSDDAILLTSNHAFDASVWQLFWPLTLGLKVAIPEQKSMFDLDVLVDTISKEQITMTDFVPSVLNVLVESFEKDPNIVSKLSSLRQLQVGGEAISSYHAYKFKNLLKHTSITNIYGPTETSIGTIFYELPEKQIESIPIGTPIDNIIAVVLDKNKKLCPIGMCGELFLGGICVGSGYLNNVERTNNSFTNINEEELKGEIFYQTGDLARVMPDGNIEFMGRLDSQVKIRGLRIELSEIENRILKHVKIKEVVVLANTKNNRTTLNAFYTTHDDITSDEIRGFLLKSLFEQMIPNKFIRIDKIPLTPIGKVDKDELSSVLNKQKDNSEFEIPSSELEKLIYNMWSEVLKTENIGVNDNFFDIGGNSLDLVKLDGHLKAEINFEESLMKLVQYPTIKSFSKYIESVQGGITQDMNINRNNMEDDVLKKRRQERRKKNLKKQ